MADDPDDTAALDPHPHIDHQADFLPGCNQAAAQEVVVGEVEEEEEEVAHRCPPPFPVPALSAPLHCWPCTVQMPSG